MRVLTLAASAMLVLAACKTPEIAADPVMIAGIETDEETRDMLVRRCLEDAAQTEESCACDVAAMEANFSQEEWWEFITGEEPEYILEPTLDEEAAKEERMTGYIEASGACAGAVQ